MIKKLLALACMALSVFAFSSCLNSDEDEITYYDDTAVTAFSLSAANRYMHTTAHDGVTDSVYKASLTVTGYNFYIDQLQGTIYNADSLPTGTDAKHILASITAKNGGTVVLALKSKAGADSLAYYTSTDSIDFTNPVKMRVYSSNGTAYREYTVKVNIHQQDGDSFAWSQQTVGDFSAIGNRKLVYSGSRLFLFGVKDGQTVAYAESNGTWAQLGRTFGADAYNNVVAKGDSLYLLDGGTLLRSADGNDWTTVATNTTLTRLIGATPFKLYALDANGLAVSADNGATWATDKLDDSASNLPASDVNFVCTASPTNADTYNLLLIGLSGGHTVIWSKVEEDDGATQQQPWTFYPEDEYNEMTLPALANLQVAYCEGELLATGGSMDKIYSSRDQGLTWSKDTVYTMPTALQGTATPFTMTVGKSGMIYLTTAGSPAIYSGRITRYGWADYQTAFNK